ncbi:MAG TPA: alpha/beta hydrolase [Chitinophagaceae bacterium]|nr:alpha/beta hydrolase [Chitinophagaceae bacterium]
MKLIQKLAIRYLRIKLTLLSFLSKRKSAEKALEIFCTPLNKSKKKTTRVFENAEKLRFQMDNYTITGFRWNHEAEQNKKRVLLLHGFESTVKNFEGYINPLIEKNYEVLAFDAPAHGESSGKQITLPLYIKTIKTIYEKFGPVQSFISHSFGGLAVTHFMENINHNSDTRIVLIAPATETTTAINSFFEFLRLGDKVKIEFNKLIEEKSGLKPSHFSIRRAVAHLHAKILWIHDEDDDITPLSDVLKIKENKHPNIIFHFTKGLGHRKIYRDSEIIKKIIGFL